MVLKDVELSVSMTGLLMAFSWLVTSVVVMVVVLPWMAIGVVVVSTVYFFVQKFYRMSGPDLQRIDAVSRSPLQAGLSEGKICSRLRVILYHSPLSTL